LMPATHALAEKGCFPDPPVRPKSYFWHRSRSPEKIKKVW
jgi:hypothetical protein